MLAEEKSAVRLAKIDASFYRDVAQKYSVTHFPTMKLFINQVESYVFSLFDRTAPVIVRWLKKRVAERPATVLQSVTLARKLIDSNERVAFGFLRVGRTFCSPLLFSFSFVEMINTTDHYHYLNVQNCKKRFTNFEKP